MGFRAGGGEGDGFLECGAGGWEVTALEGAHALRVEGGGLGGGIFPERRLSGRWNRNEREENDEFQKHGQSVVERRAPEDSECWMEMRH